MGNGVIDLRGKRLLYRIGCDAETLNGVEGAITMVPFGAPRRLLGISALYCNCFDETNSGVLGPYLKDDDTSREYEEGRIDPEGAGWVSNLRRQFNRAQRFGYDLIELDNTSSYEIKHVLGALDYAQDFGLGVFAKNPGLNEHSAVSYVAHPAIQGIIVEEGALYPEYYAALRIEAGRPDLPVWFVFHGAGQSQEAHWVAPRAREFLHMGVTFQPDIMEYGHEVQDLVLPRAA